MKRMNPVGMSVAVLNLPLAIPNDDGSFRVDRDRRKDVILTMGRVLMQLWNDLEQEAHDNCKALA